MSLRPGVFAVLFPLSLLAFGACLGQDPEGGGSTNDGGLLGEGGGGGGGGGGGDGGTSDGAADAVGPGVEGEHDTCPSGTKTTLSGMVYDPAGKLPLPRVQVFVPGEAVPSFTAGASCERCAAPKGALASTETSATGQFVVGPIHSGKDVRVVVQMGKWRRLVTVPNVLPCVDNPIAPELTRLPRSKAEGDLPLIALTTGAGDSLECLLRKMGIADSEFTTKDGAGRVHLFAGEQAAGTTRKFSAPLGGASFTDAQALWSDVAALKKYDVLALSCEGKKNPGTKSSIALQAVSDFAAAGGRIVAMHDHDYWLANGPAPLPTVATWSARANPPSPVGATIDTTFARGQELQDWAGQVGALTGSGAASVVNLTGARHNADATNSAVARRWLSFANANAGNETSTQVLSFETPVGAAPAARCGRVVWESMHVTPGDVSGADFPTECVTTDITPAEKITAFMFFYASACID